ncbi:DUF1932 domain-containing protein [Dactylosporangium sp. CS-033363]|uniref:NAD(P)-dependent oxidoreductase n=1 Tax=Dactylosporangium sp. CS-033363 TaxID=3239935 RepID=UPI003D908B13
MTVIAVLGLGEAGGRFAADLVAAGATVRGYDPRVAAPQGVHQGKTGAEACAGADLVLSVNSAADALDALEQGLPGCAPGTVWAELNTAAPAVKEAAERIAGARAVVADVAIMAPVPPKGLGTAMTASGPGGRRFADLLGPFGTPIEVLDGPVGLAATRKLLRSVFYKGLAAAAIEALEAAEAAGLRDWLAGNIAAELIKADAATLDRLVTGSRTHAVRRGHEMQAAADLLDGLGVPARVARASRDWLKDLEA